MTVGMKRSNLLLHLIGLICMPSGLLARHYKPNKPKTPKTGHTSVQSNYSSDCSKYLSNKDTQKKVQPSSSDLPELHPKMFDVRVLLAQSETDTQLCWELVSDSGFIVTDPEDVNNAHNFSKRTLKLTLSKGRLAVNGKRLAMNGVIIAPQAGHIRFAGNTYDGTLLFIQVKKNIYLINRIDLEDYLFSVLRWESWPGWPLEVNRAFAIMCRTYVVDKVLQARKKGRFFDIKSTNIHQTYKGVHSFTNLRHALHDTHGTIMAYNGVPIVAMYDSCCGGVVPAQMDGVEFSKAPYLERDYACTYCKTSKLYAWKVEYLLSDFEDVLRADNKNCVPITGIAISKKDRAGVATEVEVTTNSATFALTGKKIYSLLKNIKSLYLSVIKQQKKVIFTGRGFGHHLGLCQWGARQMVQEGWKYKDILLFYYPGITFMQVEVVDQ